MHQWYGTYEASNEVSLKGGSRVFVVAKRKLKSCMSACFRRVEQTGEEMIVTDRRRPVLRVIPIREKHPVEEVFAQRSVTDT
jgi:antitoxin (DNA-binding transcriptional repressor) of toxin-antitoxin stability system